MEFNCSEVRVWKEALSSYRDSIESLDNPRLLDLDDFYRKELPKLIHQRKPNPHITKSELSTLMQWKLTRGKWRPRLLNYISSLDENLVISASSKAFQSLPDLSKAITELTVLKGVGPATASAILAAYAPEIAPFFSDEAIVAVIGVTKEYSLKRYLKFAEELQSKAKKLSTEGEVFTPADVERALWSTSIAINTKSLLKHCSDSSSRKNAKRKRRS